MYIFCGLRQEPDENRKIIITGRYGKTRKFIGFLCSRYVNGLKKYAENAHFESACREAMEQIQSMKYGEKLTDDGLKTIRRYGIACYKKRCRVVSDLL